MNNENKNYRRKINDVPGAASFNVFNMSDAYGIFKKHKPPLRQLKIYTHFLTFVIVFIHGTPSPNSGKSFKKK